MLLTRRCDLRSCSCSYFSSSSISISYSCTICCSLLLYSSIIPSVPIPPPVSHDLVQVDSNSDGEIDFGDFERSVRRAYKASYRLSDKELAQYFHLKDQDNDELVDCEEFWQLLKELGYDNFSPVQVDRIFQQVSWECAGWDGRMGGAGVGQLMSDVNLAGGCGEQGQDQLQGIQQSSSPAHSQFGVAQGRRRKR